jgi:hypothetical protein
MKSYTCRNQVFKWGQTLLIGGLLSLIANPQNKDFGDFDFMLGDLNLSLGDLIFGFGSF